MKEFYRSGELAQICECSPDTLRHYERLGLIEKPVRSSNGYRQYRKETIYRVKQIQSALSIGFTLKELSKILRIRDNNGIPCKDVRNLAQAKLDELQAEIHHLIATRKLLQELIKEWDALLNETTAGKRAGLLDQLVGKQMPVSRNNASSNLKRRKK